MADPDYKPEGYAVAGAAHKQGDGRDRTVFILGVMPRSGTNFLHRLLCLHPDCGAVNTTPVREDYMLKHGGNLEAYIKKLKWQWGHWGAEPPLIASLAEHAGAGLTSFLHTLTEAEWVVTKTPSVEHLDFAFDLFPRARVVVIVRDGRSVVASGMSGFGWSFEHATRRWAHAVRSVVALRAEHGAPGGAYALVSYEALSADTAGELHRLFDFLGLDAARYEFEKALDLPVFGSSYVKGEADEMSWKPVEKPTSFDGTQRWASWSRFRHERFNWLAGPELDALGYERRQYEGARFPWTALNLLLDAVYYLKELPGRTFAGLKAAAKAFLQSLRQPPV